MVRQRAADGRERRIDVGVDEGAVGRAEPQPVRQAALVRSERMATIGANERRSLEQLGPRIADGSYDIGSGHAVVDVHREVAFDRLDARQRRGIDDR